MIGPSRGGLLALIVIVGAVYFTGAGSWALNNIKGLDSACYSGLSSVGAQVANPVCGSLAKGLAAIDTFAADAGKRIERWTSSLFNSTGLDRLSSLADSFGKSIDGVSSSADDLARTMQAGPASLGAGGSMSFQQAIDSFAIGQNFLHSGTSAQALPWLKQGAMQPQGFGVLSQLTLGNLYASGGQGVAANPQKAEYYLQQARQSLTLLSSSNSAQSQQFLAALPASPDKIRADVEQAIVQMRLVK